MCSPQSPSHRLPPEVLAGFLAAQADQNVSSGAIRLLLQFGSILCTKLDRRDFALSKSSQGVPFRMPAQATLASQMILKFSQASCVQNPVI
jgi:hypothetical protein